MRPAHHSNGYQMTFATIATAALLLATLNVTDALDHTHIDNHLNADVLFTTEYWPGKGITGRRIPAGGSAVDEYKPNAGVGIYVTSTTDGQKCCAQVKSDQSVVLAPIVDKNGKLVRGFRITLSNKGQPGEIIGSSLDSLEVKKQKCANIDLFP